LWGQVRATATVVEEFVKSMEAKGHPFKAVYENLKQIEDELAVPASEAYK